MNVYAGNSTKAIGRPVGHWYEFIQNESEVQERMQVHVSYLSVVSQVVGKENEVIECDPGTTIAMLLNIIIEKHGKKVKEYFLDKSTGEFRSEYISVVLGQEGSGPLRRIFPKDYNRELQNDAKVAFFIAMGGG